MENLTYMLIEAADAMQAAIHRIEKVASEQQMLVDLVNEHDTNKVFVSFTKSMSEEIVNTKHQQAVLEKRHDILREVIAACNNDENIAQRVTQLCQTFGIFGNEMPVDTSDNGKIIHHNFKKD